MSCIVKHICIILIFYSCQFNASATESEILFNPAELEWMNANPNVSFTGDPNRLPYEGLNHSGSYIGIVSEYLSLISNSTGLNFKLSVSKSRADSAKKAKAGEVDILPLTSDADLTSHLKFSNHYMSDPIVIVMHNNEAYVDNIADLEHKKIALISNSSYTSKIVKKFPGIQFVIIENIQDGLFSVSTGKVDALLCTLAVCEYNIFELGLSKVRVTGGTEFDTKLIFGVQKKHPELLSVLNKAIKNISSLERNEILDNWKKNKSSQNVDYVFVVPVITVSILFIVIFILWIRRLSHEIKLRIKTEDELKDAQKILRLSNQRLTLHRENSPLAVIEWNTKFEVFDWNPAAQKIFGFTKDEVLGKHITENILPQNTKMAVDILWNNLLKNKGGLHTVNENVTKDGEVILCEWHNTLLINDNGQVIGVTSLVSDISEKNKVEEHLRLTEKMNAIGKLTGGIAHDFNNMLGVVLGFTQLLKDSLKPASNDQIKYCDEIINASIRAAILTSKLLQFSRKVPSTAEKILINDLLNNMKPMLEKTLTSRIKLTYQLDENLWPTLLDLDLMQDTVLNLCINSMHAMPDGGAITLNTSNINLTDFEAVNLDIPPGDYILLSVSDTGRGMNQEVQVQMFEPFFTTKGSAGTGLALSHVYGFVQQSNGTIQVYSRRNKGTRIVLYFPRNSQNNDNANAQNVKDYMNLPTGNETVLIVDDEVFLLDIEEEILSQHGYTVLRAESAKQALKVLEESVVDLMLCDVIMPVMDGYQLATEVNKLYPDVKIQMVSGFSDARKIKQINDELHAQRLLKPVSAKALLIRLRTLLDEEIT